MNITTFNLFGSCGPNGASSRDNLCHIQKTIDGVVWNITCIKGVLKINSEERLQSVEFVNALNDRVEVVLYDGTKKTVYYEKEVAGDNDKKDEDNPKPKEKLQGVTKKKKKEKKEKTKTIIVQTFGANSVAHNTGILTFF